MKKYERQDMMNESKETEQTVDDQQYALEMAILLWQDNDANLKNAKESHTETRKQILSRLRENGVPASRLAKGVGVTPGLLSHFSSRSK